MNDKEYSREEKRALLALARAAIGDRLGQTSSNIPAPPLTEKNGAFVTLHKHGALRGCIGRFTSNLALPGTIREMAQAAAFEDPRFPPLNAAELDQVDLEISVLSPMRRIQDVSEVQVGRHGLYIIQGHRRGVLLPQVAADYGWDRDTFLDQTCVKAGLNPGCWRDRKTEIYVFSAEVFGEKDLDES
jgi:AmmeMemoRadiSam system protein A